jgi:hypothetical protein
MVESFVDKATSEAPATATADSIKSERVHDFPVTHAITTPNTDNPKRSTCGNSNPERAKNSTDPDCPAMLEQEANIAGACPLKAEELGSLYERLLAL